MCYWCQSYIMRSQYQPQDHVPGGLKLTFLTVTFSFLLLFYTQIMCPGGLRLLFFLHK